MGYSVLLPHLIKVVRGAPELAHDTRRSCVPARIRRRVLQREEVQLLRGAWVMHSDDSDRTNDLDQAYAPERKRNPMNEPDQEAMKS